jgi:hypothetical protein
MALTRNNAGDAGAKSFGPRARSSETLHRALEQSQIVDFGGAAGEDHRIGRFFAPANCPHRRAMAGFDPRWRCAARPMGVHEVDEGPPHRSGRRILAERASGRSGE